MQDDDATLLRRYAAGQPGADTAFTAVVHRHLSLVYSAALRQVGGDAHLAQDVAQAVFSDLARKAAAVAARPVLAGWLYRSTHYAAAKAVRAAQRRRRREQEAHAMMQDQREDHTADEAWARVRPTLDSALQELKPGDRDAILLRFFEGRAFAAIGACLGLSENAARMRVERALEKLRTQLARRGVRSTAAALSAALTAHGVAAAPAGVASAVTTASLAGGAAAAGGAMMALSFMTANKLPLTFAAAVLLGGGGTLVVQQRAQAALHEDIARLEIENAESASLRATNETLARESAPIDAWRHAAGDLPQLRAEVEALRADAAGHSATPPRASSPNRAPSTAAADPAYRLQQLDQLPKATSQKAPVFPPEFRDLGIPGSAKVAILIGADGRVQEAEATEASDDAFAAMAVEAVKQWTFEPGRKGGQPVATRMTVPILYTVRNDHADWF